MTIFVDNWAEDFEKSPRFKIINKRNGTHQRIFWAVKRFYDIVLGILLLPVMIASGIVLFVLNPFLNPGPLLYSQERMGRHMRPFKIYKFRSMRKAASTARKAHDGLERDRITPLGRLMRKLRVDELPQVINVLKGDMSFIGPRPDLYSHACEYAMSVPRYRERHVVRPGISGLAQVTLGYAEGMDAFRAKARRDALYIRRAGFRQEATVLWLTLVSVVRAAGH
ncbi:sugar transferase [Maritimibacter sp. DP07]|uniref:Sugar transferase n=1 Tax=Maritimibacter harenae TaxID=2606218 RepID=A0A845M4I2_9RHOB|nr:sugar transferase [Maritimibacter harenae]MZR14935.1 sugar transferase [Maritimibacter harenae]